MSKSVEGSTIFLTDSLAQIKKKIAGIPTNSGKGSLKRGKQGKKTVVHYYDENGVLAPSLTSLFEFVELFQGKEARARYEKDYQTAGVRFGDLKSSLSSAIYDELLPIQARRASFAKQDKLVDKILIEGANKARGIAAQTLLEIQRSYGFYQPRK